MNKRQAICECFKRTGVQSLKRSGVTRRSDSGGLRSIKNAVPALHADANFSCFFAPLRCSALLLVPERLGKGHFLFGDV